MSTKIDIRELPSRWEEALALAASGQEVIVTDGTTPRARLVPCPEWAPNRVPGLHAGAIHVATDFDAPLPDDFWTGRTSNYRSA
jgi:antitoxin (DNA-binding transcriptional repressor) of toxin-antitoxin stability system